jgi:hypothetical protein
MKRFLVFFIASVLLVGFSGISFAAKAKTTTMSGTITAVDTAAKKVTIKDEKGTDTVYGADAAQIASVKMGEIVKFSLKADGSIDKIIVKTEKKKVEKAAPATK